MANKNKATHSGTCQIYGRFQKLPGGVLSLHGYTTQWGFFNGICPGSTYKPFEQSTDRIEMAIASAEKDAADLDARSAALKAGELTEDGTAMYGVYRPARYGSGMRKIQGGTSWEPVRVNREDKSAKYEGHDEYKWAEFTYEPTISPEEVRKSAYGQKIEIGNYGLHGSDFPTVDAVRVAMNTKYAERHLDSRAADLRRYCAWQRDRIKNWKPSELKPV